MNTWPIAPFAYITIATAYYLEVYYKECITFSGVELGPSIIQFNIRIFTSSQT